MHQPARPACHPAPPLTEPRLPRCPLPQVVDLLCISDAEATRALRYYKWDLGKLQVGVDVFFLVEMVDSEVERCAAASGTWPSCR